MLSAWPPASPCCRFSLTRRCIKQRHSARIAVWQIPLIRDFIALALCTHHDCTPPFRRSVYCGERCEWSTKCAVVPMLNNPVPQHCEPRGRVTTRSTRKPSGLTVTDAQPCSGVKKGSPMPLSAGLDRETGAIRYPIALHLATNTKPAANWTATGCA